MHYRVLVASQSFHGKESLTYQSSEKLVVGQIVAVPLQRKTVLGIIESSVAKPSFSTKPITRQWSIFLPKPSLALLYWLYGYYPAPLGLITELFTPPALPIKLPDSSMPVTEITSETAELPKLTDEQAKILKTIKQTGHNTFLLHGDTGTGKTRIYVELAKDVLKLGRSVLVLTPEIGLTGPLFETFTQTFGSQVIVTHSDMTPAQRRSVWLRASTADSGLVIIGPRSALFSPLQNIGLIVVDEAHDTAYKQEQAPRYQTSRVASQLARLHKARFIMGSATPLVSDYFTFKHKKLPVLRITQTALKMVTPTDIQIIDQRQREHFTKSTWLSTPLFKAVVAALENKEQSLLFLNRRGSARLILCETCGWQAVCPHCDVPLTYHHDTYLMRCHSCDFSDQVPTSCPSCGTNGLVFRSIGTKALESEMNRLFPEARINRFDRDTEKPERLSQQYEALRKGDIDILIGTQSIAKGFDLPHLAVVGIIQADSGLHIPDYTATERTFQLLSQVSGRIGRGHRAGNLFVQTFHPDSDLLTLALQKDYETFYEREIKERELYNFPPYTYLLKVTCSRATSKSAQQACQKLSEKLKAVSLSPAVVIEGPSPRFIEKVGGQYGWHIVIKSRSRASLLKIISQLPAACTYDIDPGNLL